MTDPVSERERLDEALSAWLDGELPAAEAQALERRIAEEPELAARARELRAVDAALREVPLPEVSPALARRLRARIEREAAPPAPHGRAPRRRRRWLAPVLAAAAAALLALLVLPRLRGEPPSPIAGREPPAPETTPLPEPAHAPEPPPAPEALARREPEREAAPESAPTPEVLARREPELAPAPELEPSDEELVLALASAGEAEDLEVIEVLDWLEGLGEIADGGAS